MTVLPDDIGPGKKMRDGETEYGGTRGRIQVGRADLGYPHELDAQEKAAIMRGYGMRTPSGETKLDGTAWEEGAARLAETRDRLSGRGPEEAL